MVSCQDGQEWLKNLKWQRLSLAPISSPDLKPSGRSIVVLALFVLLVNTKKNPPGYRPINAYTVDSFENLAIQTN